MRSYIRINEKMIIRYSNLESSVSQDRMSNDGTSRNISVIGICFHSQCELAVDESIVIELQLPPHESPITPIARVIWCDPNEDGYDIGVELTWFDWQADEQLIFARHINDQVEPSSLED